MTTLSTETELRLRVRSMARQARLAPTVQAYFRGAFDPLLAEIHQHRREMWSHADLLAGYRQRFREALGLRDRLEPWVWEFADRARSWWMRPKKVVGLDERLKSYRRRAISVEGSAHARVRARLQRCNRSGNSPGQDVVTHPHVTRGPNTRRSMSCIGPAGLRRA